MQQLIHSLGIDWKVLIAQTINFVVLALVLNYFLYKPILKTLDERKKKIADDIENQKLTEKKLREIESEKKDILEKARGEGNLLFKEVEKKASLLENRLRKEAEEQKVKIVSDGKKELNMEKEKMMREIKSEAQSLIKSAIEAGFKDISDPSLDQKITDGALISIR